MNALELAKPIVDNLKKLEQGVKMFDACWNRHVLVMAPVILIIADNPMGSELCNHQGSTATRFCRMCLVTLINMYVWQAIY